MSNPREQADHSEASPAVKIVVAVTAVLCVGGVLMGVLLFVLSGGRGDVGSASLPDVVVGLSLPLIGALIAAKRAHNRIGWILLAAGIFSALNVLGNGFGAANYFDGPRLPGGNFAYWISTWSWAASIGLLPHLLLLFPDGRLPSRRWRGLMWTATIVVIAAVTVLGFGDPEALGAIDPIPAPPIPIRLPAAFVDMIGLGCALGFFGTLVAAMASLAIRLARAREPERTQLKWFTYAAGILTLTLIISFLTPVSERLGNVPNAVGVALLPISMGVAILRHQLYDIDRIINRTVVYGLVTGVLVAGYAFGVLVMQSVLPVAEDSPFAVAASTLGMAALFGPLRRRIQEAVDRRFYRRKYDAIKTVEVFSARLRDETDLDELTGDLVALVETTMQPSHVSVWLRRVEAGR